MEEKYTQSIKAGIIGGIGLILIIILSAIISISPYFSILGQIALIPAIIFILIGTGGLSAHYTRQWRKGFDYAILFGGISGFVASFIAVIFSLIVAFIVPVALTVAFIVPSMSDMSADQYTDYQFNPLMNSIFAVGKSIFGGTGRCCCSPFMLILGVFLSIIGAVCYSVGNSIGAAYSHNVIKKT